MKFFGKAKNIVWPRTPWSRKRVVLVSVVIILFALAMQEMYSDHVTRMSTNLLSNIDSTTEGEILAAKTWWHQGGGRQGKSSAHYGVRYSYQVDNTFYVGKLIHFEPQSISHSGFSKNELVVMANSALERYPIGA